MDHSAAQQKPIDRPLRRIPPEIVQANMGRIQTAESVAARVRERVTAYGRFLNAQGVADHTAFTDLPLTDKESYLLSAPYEDLLADDHHETVSILRSSGTSGRSFYWPQLKTDARWSARRLRTFLELTYQIHERRTTAVVALSLGSWVGGDHYSWCLKNVAIEAPYPFAVFSPGNRHDEVIEFLRQPRPAGEQLLVVICPSILGYLLLLAESSGRSLPLEKIRFLVTGEAFPEVLRQSLSQRAGLDADVPCLFSVYGSADTGGLGVESSASIAVRQMLVEDPEWGAELGLGSPAPHLFHNTATETYLETVQGELCVTRWQGIPLVRYNLHDSATLLSWEPLRQAAMTHVSRTAGNAKRMQQLINAEAMPDLIAVWGRSDSSVVLGGTKLTEAMLDEAVRCPEISDLLTGVYRASLIIERERPILAIDLQFRQGTVPDSDALNRAYNVLIRTLGQLQPEFGLDWQNLYQHWDRDPSQRVLRLRGMVWPELSEETEHRIKQRSLM